MHHHHVRITIVLIALIMVSTPWVLGAQVRAAAPAAVSTGARTAAHGSQPAAPALPFTLEDARAPRGVRIDLPAPNHAEASPRLGLFIGIDLYPRLIDEDLHGCVHDAWQMALLMTQRFGVNTFGFLSNAEATREAIADALAALVTHVQALRAAGRDETIPVVITFSGHGRQVIDPVGDEEDGLDETWIAADSGPEADRDVRDDELRVVLARLAALNAKVVLISDSCHSGTMHRGSVRVRSVHAHEPPPGPDDSIFADRFGAPPRVRGDHAQDAEPGIIFFAACHEARQAVEHEEASGLSSGRFTYALRRALARSGPETTYRQLFAEINLEFERLWPGDRTQRPYFHADPRTAGERFMAGGRPRAHATILSSFSGPSDPSGSYLSANSGEANAGSDETILRLSMGSIDGVTIGARFTFYDTLDDLTDGVRAMAEGIVTHVDPLACIVRMERGVSPPATACAALDLVRMRDVRVAMRDGVPVEVADMVRRLAAQQQIALHDQESGADLVITPASGAPGADAHADGIEIHHAAALAALESPEPAVRLTASAADAHDAHQPHDPHAAHAAGVSDAASDLANRTASALLQLARVLRLMSLETDRGEAPDALVRVWRRDRSNTLRAVVREAHGGVLHLTDGDLFTIDVTSRVPVDHFVHVLAIDDRLNLDVIYPLEEADPDLLRAQRTLSIAAENPFSAALDREHPGREHADGETVRIRLLIITSGARVDLTPLSMPPDAARTSRGADQPASPLRDLLSRVSIGGPALRTAPKGSSRHDSFTITTVLIDIAPGRAAVH